jgi:hypothetical protein
VEKKPRVVKDRCGRKVIPACCSPRSEHPALPARSRILRLAGQAIIGVLPEATEPIQPDNSVLSPIHERGRRVPSLFARKEADHSSSGMMRAISVPTLARIPTL